MALKLILALGLLAVGARYQLLAGASNEPLVEVQVLQGKISGVREDAGNGRSYYAFKSIPYAQPPVGSLRFSDPIPSSGWTGVRNGSVVPPKCPQIDLIAAHKGKTQVTGQEDCLYLNVYTPVLPHSSLAALPVMVYIHGGSFVFRSVQDTSPLPLLTEDVVLITFHYRIGTLGFLSTEDSVMPGNLGLKDQTMALRWVHQNIRKFGGDPQKVTIFGTSAGAVSAHFQVLTPHAEGLFQQAILQSGSALCSWASRKDHRQVAMEIGQILSCPGGLSDNSSVTVFNSSLLLQCLQDTPFERLVTLPASFVEWSYEPMVMIPRIDGDFIPEEPGHMLKSGTYNKVNLITGITAQDGALTTKFIYGNEELRRTLVQNFPEVGPLVMNFKGEEDDPLCLARKVFQYYLGQIDINDENADDVTQLFTDRLFSTCNDLTAQLHAHDRDVQVYMYELHHRGQYAYIPDRNPNITSKWVGHGDDLQYLFDKVSGYQRLERPDDLQLRHIMVKLWTNFATTGNPTPDQSLGFQWDSVTNQTLQHLRLQLPAAMHDDSRGQIRAFWNALPTKQNGILFPENLEPARRCTAIP